MKTPQEVVFALHHPDVYGDTTEDAIEMIEALVARIEAMQPHMPFAAVEPWTGRP